MEFAGTRAEPQPRSERIGQLDRIRAVACLVVVAWHVLVHVAGRAPAGQQAAWYAASQLFVWGGPAFFFLSALLCFHRHPKGAPLRGYWGRRVLLVGVPYLVWSCVYLFLELRSAQGMAPVQVLTSAGVTLLFGVKHLAFVNALFQFYLLFPGLRWLLQRASPPVLAVSGFLIGLAWLAGGQRLMPGSLPGPVYSSLTGFLPAWLPYVVLGAAAARHPEVMGRIARRPVRLWAVPALAGVGGLVLLFSKSAAGAPLYPGAARPEVLLATLLVLPLLVCCASRSRGVSASLSREFARYTPAVFFTHLFPLALAAQLVPAAWGTPTLLTLYALSTAVGTGLLIRVFRRSPGAMLVVGMLQRPRRSPSSARAGLAQAEDESPRLRMASGQ